MYIGDEEITKMYIGDTEIEGIYLGDTQIYQGASSGMMIFAESVAMSALTRMAICAYSGCNAPNGTRMATA